MVLARIVLALGVAAALSSRQLVEAAANRPYGPGRSALVALATGLHEEATAWQLDVPDRVVRAASGRPAPIGSRIPSRSPLPAPERPATAAVDEAPKPLAGVASDGPLRPAGRDPSGAPSGPEVTVSAPQTPAATRPGSQPTGTGGRLVTPLAKLRVWAGGDSLGEYVGNQLLHPIADPASVDVELDYRISTGLTRPDYFDWPARLADVIAGADPPEALVFMVGGNDNQPMEGPDGVLETATRAWYEEYRRRVSVVMDIAGAGGAQLFWIGLPPMRDGTRNEIAVHVNDLIEQEAAIRPNVTFLDIEVLFAGPDGTYSPNIADPEGRQRLARAPDGVHITYVGSTWVADRVWAAVRDRWRFGHDLSEAGRPPAPVAESQPR